MARVPPDARIRSQAAAWLARLRSEEREPADEIGFQTWLAEDLRHRQAFDLVNSVWEMAGGALADAQAIGEPVTPTRRRILGPAAIAATALVVAAGLGGGALWLHAAPKSQYFSTGIGEQRRVALADGSMMLLDTSSSARVLLTPHRRVIELISGRAHFEVAKCEARPFVVSFGDRKVVAVGTVFDVAREREGEAASVILTRGKVLVEAPAGRQLMSPGDRVQFQQGRMSADRPRLDTLTAWQAGRVVFENQTLSQAVVELNRYSRRPLVISDARLAGLRISGSYEAGDAAGFAVSVSTLLPIAVDLLPDRVVLTSRAPGAAGAAAPSD